MKNPRFLFILIFLMAALAAYIDIPTIQLFGKTISHPKINNGFLQRDLEPKLGLDLSGGVQVVMSADMSAIDEQGRDDALESAKNVVENRINSIGVKEPIIQAVKAPGQYRLNIELAGISDVDQAIELIKKAAHLEFRTVKQATLEATTEALPQDFEASGLTGADLTRAQAEPSNDPQNPGYVVSLEFNSEGAKKLEEITQNNFQKPMAMFLDDEPISWPPPVIQAVISDGKAQITGNFTADEARGLAIQLNAGALPVSLKIESQSRVGPTIGQVTIEKSILAALIGIVSVAVFMILYYRLLGLFAVVALFVYTLLVFAIFKLIPVTLTLAGIAGFILSIGMAVDANILIFERMKEEKRWGKEKLESFFAGFERALSSIRDSNVSSLITCAILFNFGTGPIRGFALTLAIGILVSMFSAIVVTRTLLRVFWVRRT